MGSFWVRGNILHNEMIAITSEGGLAICLINKTGAPSVKGSLVSPGTVVDSSFVLQTDEFDAFGVVYDNNVADGDQCLVVVSGIAEVLLKDSTSAVRGYWAKASATDGRAEVTTGPSGLGALSASEHFREIGHCIESKNSGTNVLAKIVLHFN